MKICDICMSNHKVHKHKDMLLCNRHYLQYKIHGKILKMTKKDKNEIITHEDYAEIILYDNNNEEKSRAKIDIEDIDIIKKYRWCEIGTGYVSGSCTINGKKTSILLHRLVMNCLNDSSIQCDHINCNRLDSRKENLRFASALENSRNRSTSIRSKSKFKGVSFNKNANKWRAYISLDSKQISLGYFDSIEDAISARILADKNLFKDFYNSDNEFLLGSLNDNSNI